MALYTGLEEKKNRGRQYQVDSFFAFFNLLLGVGAPVARRVSGNLCTARGDWALDPEDLSQTTESQSRP